MRFPLFYFVSIEHFFALNPQSELLCTLNRQTGIEEKKKTIKINSQILAKEILLARIRKMILIFFSFDAQMTMNLTTVF